MVVKTTLDTKANGQNSTALFSYVFFLTEVKLFGPKLFLTQLLIAAICIRLLPLDFLSRLCVFRLRLFFGN